MDNKTKNDLLDIAAELVVAPLTAYVKGREIYKNFTESETSTKIMNFADQKSQEIQKTAKKISININEKASQFVEEVSDKAMDFSKKAEEFSKKAEETFNNLDERKENLIYEFSGKADEAIKEFSENVKSAAKDFGETVQQKFNEKQESLNTPVEPELKEEPVVLPNAEEKVVLPNAEEKVVLPSIEEETIAPQANTIFEENKPEE